MYSINNEQQLYVHSTGGGVSCWGFKNAFEETELLAQRLGKPNLAPYQNEFGSLSVLDKHKQLIQLAAGAKLGTWYRKGTPDKVQRVLNHLINTGETVRVFYGDPETGRSAMEEFETIGTIGRSCGVLKVPLLVADGEHFGGQLSAERIIRITRISDGKDLYRHAGFHVPPMTIGQGDVMKFPWEVSVSGAVAARFRTFTKACAWVAFIAGESHKEPA